MLRRFVIAGALLSTWGSAFADRFTSVEEARAAVWRVKAGATPETLQNLGTAFLVHADGYFLTAGHVALGAKGYRLFVLHQEQQEAIGDTLLEVEVANGGKANGCIRLGAGNACIEGYDAALLKIVGAAALPTRLAMPLDVYVGRNGAELAHAGRRCSYEQSATELQCDLQDTIRRMVPKHLPESVKPYYPAALAEQGRRPYYQADVMETGNGDSGSPFFSEKRNHAPNESLLWVTALTAWRVPDVSRRARPTVMLESPMVRDLLVRNLPTAGRVDALKASGSKMSIGEFQKALVEMTVQELAAYLEHLNMSGTPLGADRGGHIFDIATRRALWDDVLRLSTSPVTQGMAETFPRKEAILQARMSIAQATMGSPDAEAAYKAVGEGYERLVPAAPTLGDKWRLYSTAGDAYARADMVDKASAMNAKARAIRETPALLLTAGDLKLKARDASAALKIFERGQALSTTDGGRGVFASRASTAREQID